MRALVWFRSDLRVADNRALYHACKAATKGVVAVFAICPQQWREHDWADIRADFVLRNLGHLQAALADLNVPLRLLTVDRFDDVADALIQLADRLRCDALHFNREYEANECRRDAEVGRRFESAGREVFDYDDQVILPPASVRTRAGKPYQVFTPYRRAWLAALEREPGVAPLPAPKRQPAQPTRSDPLPARLSGFSAAAGSELWPAGEVAARKRMRDFVKRGLNAYDTQRDLPGVDGTSRLSPYLTSGVISPRVCLRAARAAAAEQRGSRRKHAGPETWITELVWREFYKHLLVDFPRLSRSRAFRPETEEIPWRSDEDDFAAWREGRTGYPIVDAAMRQLNQTGWMHNRLRMITAMFLTKHLLIDWRRGEQYFMRQLVDGDLAANNGGWQWSASTGTDAVPYFRVFNPSAQSRRYDPHGEFIRRFLPELRDVPTALLHDPTALARHRPSAIDYPAPICEHASARQRAVETFARVLKRSGRSTDRPPGGRAPRNPRTKRRDRRRG
jgi:deoxyribodipyrimidine photo-lyase